ncbi:MAG: hypothetical protein K2K13_00120 [Clostridiales bacterium]|nr:hypothetical protein [Clostridiales bacterium]
MQDINAILVRAQKENDFNELCKECETLNSDLRNMMIVEKATKILETFRKTSQNAAEISPANALTAIMMNATVAGGVHSNKNMKRVAPYLDQIFGGNYEFNTVRITYMNGAQGLAQLNQYVADILKIVHMHAHELELEILLLCMLIMSSNGHISPKERTYLKSLFGYLRT